MKSESKKLYIFEIYPMSGKWYYVIREKDTYKMVYSSKLSSKEDAKKYANRRTNLYNVTRHVARHGVNYDG